MVLFGSFAPQARSHRSRDTPRRSGRGCGATVERLEVRSLLSASPAAVAAADATAQANGQLTTTDVQSLLDRAAAATASDNAIVAVVDPGGNLLGVRVEGNVSPAITGNTEKLVYSIDGAISEARTGAFFANDQGPLTARTIEQISQSTVTQSEVQTDPNVVDPNSPQRGPGLVAPIGLKGHFPPRVMFTPQVDLFNIETTNRDSIISPPAHRSGSSTPLLPSRFNVPSQYLPANQQYEPPGFQLSNSGAMPDSPPESYGFISGLLPAAQSRGLGTLPGGIPIYKDGHVVGGIGVFFPGQTGQATEENSSLNDAGFYNPKQPDLSAEAEYIAFVAAGGAPAIKGFTPGAGVPANTPQGSARLGLPPLPNDGSYGLPFGTINLVGIALNIVGPNGLQGPKTVVDLGRTLGHGDPNSGANMEVDPSGDLFLPGTPVPSGWLVLPHDSPDGGLTAADVTSMIERGIAQANQVRSAIRIPLNSTAKMVFAVSDKEGNILGLYRMPDATFFSIAVAVAKARNDAYYDNPAQLQTIDQVPGLPRGVAMTSRSFRYLAEPRYPEGIDGNPPGPFSILNDTPVANLGPQIPASSYQSVQGYEAFNPNTNFRDPFNLDNQNGIVFFPGSSALYKDVQGNGVKQLVGGLGVSGDGVDQDDDVTYAASLAFQPPSSVPRADQVSVRGARLPYFKFNRQPHVPTNPVRKQNTAIDIKPVLPTGKSPALPPKDVHRIEVFNASVAAQRKHPNRTTGR